MCPRTVFAGFFGSDCQNGFGEVLGNVLKMFDKNGNPKTISETMQIIWSFRR
jgi:hypothetical protein